jgi:hypothetical protein
MNRNLQMFYLRKYLFDYTILIFNQDRVFHDKSFSILIFPPPPLYLLPLLSHTYFNFV